MKKILLTFLAAMAFIFSGCNNGNKDSEVISGSNYEKELTDEELAKEQVFTVVEEQPEYPGGMNSMYDFLGNNIKYTEEANEKNVTGKVFVTFTVGSNGRIHDVQLLKGIGFGLDEEALRVVKAMPKWRPGRQSGEKVAVRYNLPINFEIRNHTVK